MAEYFNEGGFGMYPTALFGLLLLLAAAAYAARPERRLGPLLAGLAAATLGAGSLGFVTGVVTTFQAVARVARDDQPLIAFVGVAESLHNLALGFGLLALAALVASGGALRLALRAAERSMAAAPR
jgi:hypothetical protein